MNSFAELDAMLGVTPKKNRTWTVCAMCSEKKDYKSMYEELKLRYEYQNDNMKDLLLTDSCYELLTYSGWILTIQYHDKPLHEDIVNFVFDNQYAHQQVPFITLTFDPKKFKRLINRNLQRQYIEQTLQELINKNVIRALYGCYELHENGVVHAHFIVPELFMENETLEWIKSKFTDNINNIHAVHCCTKNFYEAVEYINKPQTKDKDCDINWWIWEKNSRNFKTKTDLKINFYSNIYA